MGDASSCTGFIVLELCTVLSAVENESSVSIGGSGRSSVVSNFLSVFADLSRDARCIICCPLCVCVAPNELPFLRLSPQTSRCAASSGNQLSFLVFAVATQLRRDPGFIAGDPQGARAHAPQVRAAPSSQPALQGWPADNPWLHFREGMRAAVIFFLLIMSVYRPHPGSTLVVRPCSRRAQA